MTYIRNTACDFIPQDAYIERPFNGKVRGHSDVPLLALLAECFLQIYKMLNSNERLNGIYALIK